MTPMEQANAAVRIAAQRVEPTGLPSDPEYLAGTVERTEPGWQVALVGVAVVLVFLGLLVVLV